MNFSPPAGNSRRRRRLKNPGAAAPGFTGAWGRQPPTSERRVYTGALLALNRCNWYNETQIQSIKFFDEPGKVFGYFPSIG